MNKVETEDTMQMNTQEGKNVQDFQDNEEEFVDVDDYLLEN